MHRLTPSTFDELCGAKSTLPCVVMFSPQRCQVCTQAVPLLRTISREVSGVARVGTVDCSRNHGNKVFCRRMKAGVDSNKPHFRLYMGSGGQFRDLRFPKTRREIEIALRVVADVLLVAGSGAGSAESNRGKDEL